MSCLGEEEVNMSTYKTVDIEEAREFYKNHFPRNNKGKIGRTYIGATIMVNRCKGYAPAYYIFPIYESGLGEALCLPDDGCMLER